MKLEKGDIVKTKGKFKPKAIVVMIDEMSEVMTGSDFKLVSKIQRDIESIARLGRAAGVHLVLATQRPSSNIISADLRNNIQQSVLLGDFDSSISGLVFDKDISHLSKPEIKGRGFVKSGKDIIEFQSYWTDPEKDFEYNETRPTVIDETSVLSSDGNERKRKMASIFKHKNTKDKEKRETNLQIGKDAKSAPVLDSESITSNGTTIIDGETKSVKSIIDSIRAQDYEDMISSEDRSVNEEITAESMQIPDKPNPSVEQANNNKRALNIKITKPNLTINNENKEEKYSSKKLKINIKNKDTKSFNIRLKN